MATKEIKVPDIGGFEDVPVIEVLVQEGDSVDVETPLVTLESDKAAMDVPSPAAGTVKKIIVSVDDKVSEGSPILMLEAAAEDAGDTTGDGAGGTAGGQAASGPERDGAEAASEPPPSSAAKAGGTIEAKVPDIGDFSDVEVIEVHVKPGDELAAEDPMITLESDKATMDVPAPRGGKVAAVKVEKGQRVSEGDVVLTLEASEGDTAATGAEAAPQPRQEPEPAGREPGDKTQAAPPVAPPTLPAHEGTGKGSTPHASPSVRRFARELGVDIAAVEGSGRKRRILKEDVQSWVKKRVSEPPPGAAAAPGGGAGIPAMSEVDFAQFGEVETVPLSRIKKLTATNLHRAWLNVPHVTQHEEADITELEDFRKRLKNEAAERGVRVTMLAFLMKACVAALREYPRFNASLAKGGENLILKHYYHIGIAVDTPDGLVVPAVRDVDRKGIYDLAAELGEISERARNKKLSPRDLQGATFTISSLGGIGGTAFTPIVNAPEVAILGVSRAQTKPVYQDGEFAARLMLPLALSYDHRVVDGADGARFVVFLARVLEDARRLLL